MDLPLFEEVAEAARGLVPRELGAVRCRARRYGVKVWFETADPPRQHYEAQVVGLRDLPDGAARVLALEIGFHAEHRDEADNEAALAALVRHERRWRRELGPAAVAGTFLGRAEGWRRLSETWADPDLGDPDLPFEVGARLADYVLVLEPLRR